LKNRKKAAKKKRRRRRSTKKKQRQQQEQVPNTAVSNTVAKEKAFSIFPRLLAQACCAFSYSDCSFSVQKSKESTGRVCIFRESGGKTFSYTLEASLGGVSFGPLGGFHLDQSHLEGIGHAFADALLDFWDEYLLGNNAETSEDSDSAREESITPHQIDTDSVDPVKRNTTSDSCECDEEERKSGDGRGDDDDDEEEEGEEDSCDDDLDEEDDEHTDDDSDDTDDSNGSDHNDKA
jgi:hypothetical protein